MAVQIRLSRHGTKKAPFYRIVVTDRRNPRDGRFIELIGTFDPNVENAFKLDQQRFAHWTGRGAKASPTLEKLVKQHAKTAGAAA
jgi:small subunit ribosomal protein S16